MLVDLGQVTLGPMRYQQICDIYQIPFQGLKVFPINVGKEDILKSFGAKIERTPTEAAHDDPESLLGVARRFHSEIPNSHILDQYANPNNPDAHYFETAKEILDEDTNLLDISTKRLFDRYKKGE